MFVSIEGLDGSGKTTFTNMLIEELTKLEIKTVRTREPGGSLIGNKIRDILISNDEPMSPLTEFFLLLANRTDHVEKIIKPGLEAGNVVVTERFMDSTFALQVASGLNLIDYANGLKAISNLIWPTLTLYLDVDFDVARERVLERKGNMDRIERKGEDYHRRVHANYMDLIQNYPERIVVVNGNVSLKGLQDAAEHWAREIELLPY